MPFYRFVFALPFATILFAPALAAPGSAAETDARGENRRGWGPAVGGLRLSAATEKPRYAPGESIVLNLLLKNVGNKVVRLWEERPSWSYKLSVRLPDGKNAPLTPMGRWLAGEHSRTVSSSGLDLKPGQACCVEFVINAIYDFPTDGTCVLSAQRIHIFSVGGVAVKREITVPSNALRVAIDRSLPAPKYHFDEELAFSAERYVWLSMPEDQKIEEFRFGNQCERLDAVKWLGERKRPKAVPVLVRRAETIVEDKRASLPSESELAAICYWLGRIGDPKGYPAVRKACDHLSRTLPRAPWPGAISDLFRAYEGLALLGHKKDAAAELKGIYEREKARMEPLRRSEFEQQLALAEKW